ncbi:SRPBCC domain-containing protein [Aliifodinibius sp. S!AR15-10]|uniref:SRPBCC family protein n=1 Tax=Aliifodinibius sp. S!AR15-10 TaxID=2950437 RepID=UPI0028614B2A|nr:SRPBCC domain-containing protein [Aliifodinibius sp. S!AR15-10]MDR8393899.1 SRPBCC domain-containing protein [Aliifodinibius sp. S!AR15-10]
MNKKRDLPVKVRIVKEFKASPQKVFDAWLDPEMISKWMFGPDVREEEILKLKNDPKEGGSFSYVVKRGKEEIDHMGTYFEIDRPNRLVFSWGAGTDPAGESVVTIEIEPTGQGCRLTLVHELAEKWAEYADRTKEGWSYMMGKLKEILA